MCAIIDILRIWVGPHPSWLCTFVVMFKNQSFISIVVAFTSVTILKFTFLCLFKRIPEMDDDFVAKSITRSIWFVSISIVCSKFWYEKPNMQQVKTFTFYLQYFYCEMTPFQCICMGYYDPQWNNLPSIFKIPTIGILIHTLLMIPVLIQTRKHEVQEIIQNLNAGQKQSKSVESFLINCLSMVVFSLGTMNLAILNR